MGLFTAPAPSPYSINAPIIHINLYPLWSYDVAFALYFTEVAGMLMAIIGLMEWTGKYGRIGKIGGPVVFITTILAFAFFASDLGRPSAGVSAPLEAFANFGHSWMARGIIFVSGLLLFSFLYTATTFLKSQSMTWLRLTFATLGFLFGLFSTVYSGFEFAAATGIPFWNNAGVPTLFLAGGAFVGSGLLYLISMGVKGEEGMRARRLAAKLIAFSGIAELASWFLFLASVNTAYVFNEVAYYYLTSQATFYADLALSSLAVLLSGFSYLGSVPVKAILGGKGGAQLTDLPSWAKGAIAIAAIFAIVAAFFTRADILFAGQYAYMVSPQTPFQIVSNQPIPIGSFGWRG